jgi:hypothetical protein
MSRALVPALLLSLSFALPAQSAQMRSRSGPYELQVLVGGRPVRTFWHEGETWALGQLGERYTLRVSNHSSRPIEAVISVDGRDVIDGQPGNVGKRGYLVPAYGVADIDGWRISQSQAAAFRFSSVSDSYAERTGSGREVGVIGVAIFEQRPPPVAYIPPPAYPEPEEQPCCTHGAREKAELEPQQHMNDASGPVPAAPSASAPAKSAGGEGRAMAEDAPVARKKSRSGLGTEYGEALNSSIRETYFERASSRPSAVVGCRYNDRDGLIAQGIDVDGLSETMARRTADPFPVVERGFAPPPPGWRE